MLAGRWPPWLLAWGLAGAIFAGFKWLTFAGSAAVRTATLNDSLCYLFLWPGMDAEAFLSRRPVAQPETREVILAIVKTASGLLLIFGVARFTTQVSTAVTGWIGLIGLALFLLFGVSHLISIVWRMRGVDAQPIMNRPIAATSLTDFWGQRWNLAFHTVGHAFVFRPLRKRIGLRLATLAVFLFSGLVHDLVMSATIQAGLGLPTLYFFVQFIAVLFERSRFGRRCGLGRGWRGRVYAAVIILLPLGLVFHRGFLEQVIVPTLELIVAI